MGWQNYEIHSMDASAMTAMVVTPMMHVVHMTMLPLPHYVLLQLQLQD